MSNRGILEVVLRGLSVYFAVGGITNGIYILGNEATYRATMSSDPDLSLLPMLAYPMATLFLALGLWLMARRLAAMAFPIDGAEGSSPALQDLRSAVAFGLGIYFAVVGLTGVVSFLTSVFLGGLENNVIALFRPVTWNQLAESIVWLLAGFILLATRGAVRNSIKSAADNVADTLWRITPEDEKRD